MQTLPDTFCVFILTHGRPDNVITFDTLNRRGYTGRLYFVVDNEDKTVNRYRHNFGAENVIVFDKKAIADAGDEGNNFDDRRCIVHARNACFAIAEQLGVTHFLELDDDYTAFDFRVVVDDKGLVKPTKDLDAVLCKCLSFYETVPVATIAFAQGGDFLGGIDNGKSAYRFSRRKCMNTFFCSTERPFRFLGSINEDVNTYTTLGSRGELFLTVPVFSITQKQTQGQSGGMTAIYQDNGTYLKSFSTVIMMPSAVSVSMMSTKHQRLHHKISWAQCVPCIVPERYKVTAPPAPQ